jgi:hypothetical protein
VPPERLYIGKKVHFWIRGKRRRGTVIAINDGTYIVDSGDKEYKTKNSDSLHDGWVDKDDNPDCCQV